MSCLTPALREALLIQTACGMSDLRAFLESELDFICMCQDSHCNPQLQYLHTHLALIESAQVFARNRIDETNRQFSHNTQERYTAFSDRHTDSESTATGRSCNWAAATSSQNFYRDSTDDQVAFSEANALRTAEVLEDGYDRSSRITTGSAFHFSKVIHTLDDKEGERLSPGQGLDVTIATRNSSTNGGTGPLLPIVGTKWESAFTLDTTPPFIHPVDPGPLITITPAGTADQVCPRDDPEDPDDDDRCDEVGLSFPSAGQGFHGRFNMNISLIIAGTGTMNLTASYERGANIRQYWHCTTSSVRGQSNINSTDAGLSIGRTEALPSDNKTQSRETTNIYHLVRKHGSSTRRGTDTTDAQDRQIGRSRGQSHAESERDSKGQAYQQRRAESLTVQHSESHLRRTETLRDDEVRRAYGQIPTQLAELWKRVWTRLNLLERQFAAVPFGAAMNCPPVCNPCIRR